MFQNKFFQKKSDSKTKALVSTAFQDHISKQLELDSLVNLNFKKAISKNKPIKTDAKSKVDSGLKSNQILNLTMFLILFTMQKIYTKK